MIIVALIGYGFYSAAKRRAMNTILWTILGIGSYFFGQVIAGFIIGFTNPQMVNDELSLTVIGLISGLAGVFVTFLIMVSVDNQKNRLKNKITEDESLLDSSEKKAESFESSNKIHDDI
jgi:fructose-specific phosphotransferase system IIC component